MFGDPVCVPRLHSGVISEADKAKQAVGGVQLVRFSFPPNMDRAAFHAAIQAATSRLYTLPATL